MLEILELKSDVDLTTNRKCFMLTKDAFTVFDKKYR